MDIKRKVVLLLIAFFSFSLGYGQLYVKVHYNLVLKNTKNEALDTQNPLKITQVAKLIAESTEESLDEDMQKVQYEITRTEVSQYRNGTVVTKKKINTNEINFNEFVCEKGDKLNIKITGLKQINSKGEVKELKMEEISPKDLKMFMLKIVWGE